MEPNTNLINELLEHEKAHQSSDLTLLDGTVLFDGDLQLPVILYSERYDHPIDDGWEVVARRFAIGKTDGGAAAGGIIDQTAKEKTNG